LRLYAWEPPGLSLGRGQPGADVDRAACAQDGVDVVRRPTGGRAILHTDELTYSVVAPLDEPRIAGDIPASYRRLSHALLAALQHLGIDAQSQTPSHGQQDANREPRDPNPVCFEVPSHYELTTTDGRKLLGSAQMRTHDTVLQHGALPLVGDIARICRYLTDAPNAKRVRAHAVTLGSASGRPVTWDEVAQAMVIGFGSALNLELRPGELAPQEQDWTAALRREKYASDGWTWRV
jgi:lipoate-protein ligase A